MDMRTPFAQTCALPKLQKEVRDLPLLYMSNVVVFICCFLPSTGSLPFFIAICGMWLAAIGLYALLVLRLHKRLMAAGDELTLTKTKLRAWAGYAFGSYIAIVAMCALLMLK
jgi:hypothetical protein